MKTVYIIVKIRDESGYGGDVYRHREIDETHKVYKTEVEAYSSEEFAKLFKGSRIEIIPLEVAE